MSAADNFVYDSESNLIEDKSKHLKISYDWRGMPVEFTQYPSPENTGVSDDTLYRLLDMPYSHSEIASIASNNFGLMLPGKFCVLFI